MVWFATASVLPESDHTCIPSISRVAFLSEQNFIFSVSYYAPNIIKSQCDFIAFDSTLTPQWTFRRFLNFPGWAGGEACQGIRHWMQAQIPPSRHSWRQRRSVRRTPMFRLRRTGCAFCAKNIPLVSLFAQGKAENTPYSQAFSPSFGVLRPESLAALSRRRYSRGEQPETFRIRRQK